MRNWLVRVGKMAACSALWTIAVVLAGVVASINGDPVVAGQFRSALLDAVEWRAAAPALMTIFIVFLVKRWARRRLAVVPVCAALLFLLPAYRADAQLGGGVVVCTNCASDLTAGAQLAKEASTALQTAAMVQSMAAEAVALAKNPNPSMLMDIGNVSALLAQSQGVAGSVGQMNAIFQGTYSPYNPASMAPYANTYNNWATTTLRTLNGSISAAGYQGQMIQNEQAWLSLMQALTASPLGRNASLQLGNSIGTAEIGQLQALRQLMASQSTAQAAFMANQVNAQQAQQFAQDSAFTPLNWTASGKGW